MGARTRQATEAARSTTRHVRALGEEFRERRLSLGLIQAYVALSAGISRNHYARIEAGRVEKVTLASLERIAAVLGLDLAVRAYPGGQPIRDAAHSTRLASLLDHVRRPLSYRVEVPLPAAQERWERRAWDAIIFGNGERTAIELEMRLRDVQAMRRRHDLKRRDDPTNQFLLLVADSRHNRRVIAEFEALFEDLPRLRPGAVRAALAVGRHPPTGLLFV